MSSLVLLNLQNLQNNVAVESGQRSGGGAERPIAPTQRPLVDEDALLKNKSVKGVEITPFLVLS